MFETLPPVPGGDVMCVQTSNGLEALNASHSGVDAEIFEGAGTILFVEDETFVREVTCEVLRSAGYRVLTAKNAVEAGRIYDQHTAEVELLLSDVVLAGETGRALAGRLRRENPELRVLLVTGYGDQMNLGGTTVEECLAKPFSSEVLLKRVRRVLEQGAAEGSRESSQACRR